MPYSIRQRLSIAFPRFPVWSLALNRKEQDHPSRQPKLEGKGEARLIAERCGPPPQGPKRWTLQLLADRLVVLPVGDDISYETVRRTLKERLEASFAGVLVYSSRAQCRIRGGDGRCAGRVLSAV